jgi:hypothetical protein
VWYSRWTPEPGGSFSMYQYFSRSVPDRLL